MAAAAHRRGDWPMLAPMSSSPSSAILVLVPIYWIVATSFKPTSEILVTPTSLLTDAPDTRPLSASRSPATSAATCVNSLIAAGGATALGFLLSVPAAWGFAKFAYPGSGALLSFTVVTRVFPPIALALPFFLQFRALGLIDTAARPGHRLSADRAAADDLDPHRLLPRFSRRAGRGGAHRRARHAGHARPHRHAAVAAGARRSRRSSAFSSPGTSSSSR